MAIFYIDKSSGSEEISYGRLYKDVSHTISVRHYVRPNDIYLYFKDIVFAMANGKSIALLDRDFTKQELDNLGIGIEELSEECTIDSPVPINNHKDLIEAIERNQDSVRLGIYTSGTTGKPKRFDHTVRSLLRNIKVSGKHGKDIWGFAYNCTHFAGIQVFLQALMNENTLVNIFDENAQCANEYLTGYGCNCISATPTYYRNFILVDDMSNKNMYNVTFGGEKFSNSILEKVKQKFPNAKIRNVYASTEVGSLLSGRDESFFIPDSMKELIRISPENHLLLHRSIVLHKDIEENWYDTNDIVKINADGSFKILSRDSDFINVGEY